MRVLTKTRQFMRVHHSTVAVLCVRFDLFQLFEIIIFFFISFIYDDFFCSEQELRVHPRFIRMDYFFVIQRRTFLYMTRLDQFSTLFSIPMCMAARQRDSSLRLKNITSYVVQWIFSRLRACFMELTAPTSLSDDRSRGRGKSSRKKMWIYKREHG